MKTLSRRFDAFYKAVLRNAAWNYLNSLKRRREKEKSFDLLSVSEQRQLTTADRYPSDSISFSAYGYELLIENETLARAFSSLTRREQTVLILRFAAGYNDREIGELIGLARSTIQYHRSTALRAMKRQLTFSPEEGGGRDKEKTACYRGGMCRRDRAHPVANPPTGNPKQNA